MSRIKSDKVNYGSSILVNFPDVPKEYANEFAVVQNSEDELNSQKYIDELNLEAQNIISEANLKALQITQDADDLLKRAQVEAQQIIEQAKQSALELEQNAQLEIDTIKENASQEGAKQGYEAGYADGLNNIEQDMKQKIQDMEDLVHSSYEMKNRILNTSKREIVELVLLIAKKICLNGVDEVSVGKVVDNSIALLNDKENIELVVSEKYANLLNQLFNSDNQEHIDIDKLKQIKLTYNSKISDDTIIVQTPKERLDLSFTSQVDEIARKFLHRVNVEEV